MHTDPELLALLALGEQIGAEDDRLHLQTCPVCAAELAELRQVVVLARAAGDVTLAQPDPRVWVAVRDEVVRAAAATSGSGPRAHASLASASGSWSQASGEADLATDDRGRRVLQVTLHADLPAEGVRQAWLVHRDDPRRRQSLGMLDGPNGLWTVERSIDLEQYRVLDISQQDLGSMEHSGESIVRGELVLVG